MFPEMDDQKVFWIFDVKADRNDGSVFFPGRRVRGRAEPAYLVPRCVAGAVRAR